MEKPTKVDNVERFWDTLPKDLSPRCQWWCEQIRGGWKPNRRISAMGYHDAAKWYGVYISEFVNVVSPLLQQLYGD